MSVPVLAVADGTIPSGRSGIGVAAADGNCSDARHGHEPKRDVTA
jgi:hypothetical protein